MNVPKYVIDLMSRAKYNYTASGEKYATGYTIDIAKYSHYEHAKTFRDEIERLVDWANKQYKKMGGEYGETAHILSVPKQTAYKYMQYATVTIYDPVMRHIEKYIGQEKEIDLCDLICN